MPHSAECLRQQEQDKLVKEAYEKAWPKYCHFCNGEGGYHGSENVGERDQPVIESYFDPCPVCLKHGRCPRCGAEEVFTEEYYAQYTWDKPGSPSCPRCGWLESKPDALPVVQCTCDPGFPEELVAREERKAYRDE